MVTVKSDYPVSLEVCKYLVSIGYHLCTKTGIKRNFKEKTPCVGILSKDYACKSEWFGCKRRRHLGVLKFRRNWKLEVYGRCNLKAMTALAEDLSEKFSVDILVRVNKETEQTEAFYSDFS